MSPSQDSFERRDNLFTRTVLRAIVLHLPWPKGKVKAPPGFFPPTLQDFETERRLLIEAVEIFCREVERSAPERRFPHPLFGPLTARTLVRLQAKHVAHHLHQFGI